MAKILREFSKENMVLDIGSGYAPQPNCVHIDIREDLPELDIVCDFSSEALPFSDGEVAGIISNHCIEHIKWTKVSFMVKEWARVLRDGGFLKLRTPNLEFIVKNYLNGVKTSEWPDDEKTATSIFGECGYREIALIKLFSGQDYESNTHYACYDFDMLSRLLKISGFGSVELSKFETKYSPGELQVTAYK